MIHDVHEYMSNIFQLKLNGLSARPNGFKLEETKQYLPDSVSAIDKLCAVAMIEGRIVGQLAFSGYTKTEYTHGGKFGMSVHPNYWRKGIGTSLLVYLESWAEANDFEKLELEVWSNNTGAISLYKKQGYSIEGCRKHAIKTKGLILDVLLMGKILPQ